jgi:hypothetical protein
MIPLLASLVGAGSVWAEQINRTGSFEGLTKSWCGRWTTEDGAADRLDDHRACVGYSDGERFEVLHHFTHFEDLWRSRWLYHAPGSGIWFDPGHTIAFDTHGQVNAHFGVECPCHLFGYDVCAKKKKICNSTECPTINPAALDVAREKGFNSVQVLRHWMDSGSCLNGGLRVKFEVIDLTRPYEVRPKDGSRLLRYFTGPAGPVGRPCLVHGVPQKDCPMRSAPSSAEFLGCKVPEDELGRAGCIDDIFSGMKLQWRLAQAGYLSDDASLLGPNMALTSYLGSELSVGVYHAVQRARLHEVCTASWKGTALRYVQIPEVIPRRCWALHHYPLLLTNCPSLQ